MANPNQPSNPNTGGNDEGERGRQDKPQPGKTGEGADKQRQGGEKSGNEGQGDRDTGGQRGQDPRR